MMRAWERDLDMAVLKLMGPFGKWRRGRSGAGGVSGGERPCHDKALTNAGDFVSWTFHLVLRENVLLARAAMVRPAKLLRYSVYQCADIPRLPLLGRLTIIL